MIRPPAAGGPLTAPPLAVLLAGCVDARGPVDPSAWFDPGSDYDVLETVLFTDVPYDFAGDTPIGSVPLADDDETMFAPADEPANDDCTNWVVTNLLPVEITGLVTIFPRYYYKARSGCKPTDDILAAEKFYGSYFLQDASGGTFVLGDTKIAAFDAGDRVTLKVRGVKDSFGLKMVAVSDVLSIERGPEPIYYEVPDGDLDDRHTAKVVRVEGTVQSEVSTFGEVYLADDDGVTTYKIGLDQELTRRGVDYPVGARLQVTGPVIFSFDEYTVVAMQLGQIVEL
jgi:hypothetical protein